MKRKWPLLLLLLPVLALLAAWPSQGSEAFESDRKMIALRRISHELLRASGDSSSRIVPPQSLPSGGYRISFASAFAFSPDTLVKIIDASLRGSALPKDYIVQVTERPGGQVVFGFAMLPSEGAASKPCLGRNQPERLYDLTIRFREPASRWPIWLGASGLLATGLFLVGRRRKKPLQEPAPEPAAGAVPLRIAIGRFNLDPAAPFLYFESEQIALTGKEHRLLCILAQRPNELIDRAVLQKIWEDEGVIVGRSLDVFVSRLRKKLERDPAIAIVGVTGRGYRLEVPAIDRT